jgi:hypothetical protein
MQGCHWKEIEGLAPEDGLELEIPVLQQALRDRSDFTMNEWHQMNVWGLQSRHYVRVGNRIMKPQRQRNHKLAKWLKNAGWRIDMTSMDNMFATFNAHNHYFVIHWNPQDKVFELCDPLAKVTTEDHHEAMVLLWAMLLASARTEDNLWTVEPRLSLSEEQILGGFRSFLLGSLGGERCGALTEEDKINLQRMGIEIQGMAARAAEVWTWRRNTSFPQQSNGNDCGMVAVVAITHLARGWRLPTMDESVIDQYRQWLMQTIGNDNEDLYKVPCPRCGTTHYSRQITPVMCGNRLACNIAREDLSDAVICVEQQGHHSVNARGQKRMTQKQGAGSRETSKAPHSVEKGDNQEAGGSKNEALLAGEKQVSTVGVSRTDGCALTSGTTRSDTPRSLPENGKTVKRQRSLNEIFAPTTNKDEREKNQVNGPGASKLVLPLKTQTKRDDTTQASWVRNSFGAKQGQRCGVPQCQEASKRCAECSSIVVNCTMQERCVRCKIPTYCGNQCKERHWTKSTVPSNASIEILISMCQGVP